MVNAAMRPLVETRGFSSLLFTPIRARRRTIGLVTLGREGRSPPYTIEDQALVQTVVDEAALTLDNARLVRALCRQGELDAALLAAQSELGEGVVVLDLGTMRLAHVNDAFAAMVGFRAAELEALRSFLDLLPVEDVSTQERSLRECRARGAGTGSHTATLVRKGGSQIEVEVSTKPLGGEGGDRLVGLVRDVTERNRTERAVLLEAEVLDQVDAAVLRWDPESRIVHWGRGAGRLFGWSPDDAQGAAVSELLFPPGRAERADELHAELTERGLFEGELELRRADASVFTAFCRLVAIRDGGEVSGFAGILVDASERRRAQDELEESREHFRAQYQMLPVPTYTWKRGGDDFVLVDFNDAAHRFTEGRVEALIGTPASDLYGHDPAVIAELREALVARGSTTREIDFPMASLGEVRRLSVTYVHVPPNLVMVHTEDVTARRKAEEGLRFRARLVDDVDAAVVAVDAAGVVTHWNPGARELYGWSSSEAVGASIRELAERAEIEDRDALLRRIEAQGGEWEAEFRVRRGDELVPVYARTTPVTGESGETLGYVGVSVDTSERERAEGELHQAEIRYRTLVERLPAVTYVADLGPEGRWRFVSPRSSRCSATPPKSGGPRRDSG
jgi:PAS domain S-box-containing protein